MENKELDKLPQIHTELGDFYDIDKIKHQIRMSICPSASVAGLPHEDVCEGLSKVFYLCSDEYTILITREVQQKLSLINDVLIEYANKHTPSDYEAEIYNLTSVIHSLQNPTTGEPVNLFELAESSGVCMNKNVQLLLKAKNHPKGATAILYPGIARRVNLLFGAGCYFVPSSTEEILVVSKALMPLSELTEMVRDVNKQVPHGIFLSDSVYEYDWDTNRIRAAVK